MLQDERVTERDGKQYCSLPDGSQILIENDVINNPLWIDIQAAEKLLSRGDRQIRNLAKKHNWHKKYAYLESKPVRFFYKPELEDYIKSRVTEAVIEPPTTHLNKDPNTNEVTPGNNLEPLKSVISKSTVDELDNVVKKLEPYVEDFLKTYKTNQERIISLEEKRGEAEKSAVFWRTSSAWLLIVVGLSLLAWYQISQLNKNLSKSSDTLSTKVDVAQKELYETKLLLNQKDVEIKILKQHQGNSSATIDPVATETNTQ